MIIAHSADEPPLDVAIDITRSLTRKNKGRIAFAGRAGAGKTTLANYIAGNDYFVINHADPIKEEILEWLTDSVLYGHEPDSEDAFSHFCGFIGLSPRRVEDDLWDMVGPVYSAFVKLHLKAIKGNWNLSQFLDMAVGEHIAAKVAFVDSHKVDFRSPLQVYSEMTKEIAADPYYWVNRTISRSVNEPICFNADTRFRYEIECLKMCGWTTIFLDISDETQAMRRPEMTDDERMHQSEWDISALDCDFTIDSNKSESSVLMQLSDYLTAKAIQYAR